MIKIANSINKTIIAPLLMAGVVLILILTFIGVGFLSKSVTIDDIEEHEALWKSSKPEAFSYTVVPICFCRLWPYKVVVYGESFTVSPVAEMPQKYIDNWNVPDKILFEHFFNLAKEGLYASTISIEFDEKYAFPSKMYIDWQKNVIDEEYGMQIKDFKELKIIPANNALKEGTPQSGAP